MFVFFTLWRKRWPRRCLRKIDKINCLWGSCPTACSTEGFPLNSLLQVCSTFYSGDWFVRTECSTFCVLKMQIRVLNSVQISGHVKHFYRDKMWFGSKINSFCLSNSQMVCTPHPILCGWWNREEWDGRGMWYVWRKGEKCTRCWWGNRRERDHWGDQDVGGRIILNGFSGSGKGLWGLDGVGSG
jgi:hypothetical protein